MSRVAAIAKNWIGNYFNDGQTEQCMAFVRDVLHEAGHPLANVITKNAVDNLPSGYYLASSLAGRDVGPLVTKVSDLQPGDVIFWQDTYGNWPKGTITHVGIYVGDNKFVHRPTVSRPVEVASLTGFWATQFRCGLQAHLFEKTLEKPTIPPKPQNKYKIYANPDKARIFNNNKEFKGGKVELLVKDGKIVEVKIDGKLIDTKYISLEITHGINGN